MDTKHMSESRSLSSQFSVKTVLQQTYISQLKISWSYSQPSWYCKLPLLKQPVCNIFFLFPVNLQNDCKLHEWQLGDCKSHHTITELQHRQIFCLPESQKSKAVYQTFILQSTRCVTVLHISIVGVHNEQEEGKNN